MEAPGAVSDEPTIERARRIVGGASRVTVLTGAGISTESGIPDFRGPKGVWTRDPTAERLAHIDVYVRDRDARRTAWRRRLDSRAWTADPNAGHRALLALERRGQLHTLITQNIDGLHHVAGSDPERIVEVHGNVREVVCLSCEGRWPMAIALERVRAGDEDPACAECGGILKSATVSFGQSLADDDLERADVAARECDVLLAVGSSLTVSPICNVVPLARVHGASVVIVNAEETPFDYLADVVVTTPIGHALPAILE